MKTSLPLVAAVLSLLLMVATVKGIRLDPESHAAFSNQMDNKSLEKGAVIKTDGEPSGDVEKTISEEDKRVGHSLPEIHVDYYGPRGHNARHH